MPTYEYRCPKGHAFEVFQRISDEPGALCPECGEKAERQLSAGAGLLFKGSGFYITDYAKSGSKSGETKETKSSSTTAETKPSSSGSSSSDA